MDKPIVEFRNARRKPLSQVTATDIPRGLDAEDVMTHDDVSYVFAFVDAKRSLDKKVIGMLKQASIPYEIFPPKGDFPIISYASKEYCDIGDVHKFIKEYRISRRG